MHFSGNNEEFIYSARILLSLVLQCGLSMNECVSVSMWLLNFYEQRKYEKNTEKRCTCGYTTNQLGLLTTGRDMCLLTRKRSSFKLCAPVKCVSTVCYSGFSHVCPFFQSVQIPQSTVHGSKSVWGNNFDIFSLGLILNIFSFRF